ncbi:uncharacterized protein A4U43_C07F20150 [Asparagus officinalis]|uniref:Uncharacterized protein n=1 Tax=Asparagus officinalis TaxID=4686 RepID=A0A5P1EFB2_ASPOF|nr:uncharacterized protein A4U43_C07F20150 [Asparagus officinalis]
MAVAELDERGGRRYELDRGRVDAQITGVMAVDRGGRSTCKLDMTSGVENKKMEKAVREKDSSNLDEVLIRKITITFHVFHQTGIAILSRAGRILASCRCKAGAAAVSVGRRAVRGSCSESRVTNDERGSAGGGRGPQVVAGCEEEGRQSGWRRDGA